MCFTVAIHASREEIEKRFDASFDELENFVPDYYFSAFTFPKIPVITGKDNRVIRMYKWGLIPSWVKDESYAEGIRTKTINAKSETITEKPSFRNAFRTNRCLVISKGFFEWTTREKEQDCINPGLPLSNALELLVPYNQEKMKAWTISKLISTPGAVKNIPGLIEPFDYGKGR